MCLARGTQPTLPGAQAWNVCVDSTDKAVRPTNVMGQASVLLNWCCRHLHGKVEQPVLHGALWKCAGVFWFGCAVIQKTN